MRGGQWRNLGPATGGAKKKSARSAKKNLSFAPPVLFFCPPLPPLLDIFGGQGGQKNKTGGAKLNFFSRFVPFFLKNVPQDKFIDLDKIIPGWKRSSTLSSPVRGADWGGRGGK